MLGLFSCIEQPEKVVHEYLRGENGKQYQILYWNDLNADVTLERPDREDPKNQICISLVASDSSGAPLRHFNIIQGKASDISKFNPAYNAGILTKDGKLSIHFVEQSGIDEIKQLCGSNGSFVQLRPVLRDGVALVNDNRKKFQCRAIVEFNDGRVALIETLKHNTLRGFTEDLIHFDVKNAVTTVTGVLDEGWYYYAKVPVALGRLRTYTDQQTNWLVFRD